MKRIVRRATCLVLLAAAFGVGPRADEQAVKKEKISGYAEWRRGNTIIVDGQRVVAVPATQFKGKAVRGLEAIALGFEVGVEGARQPDGSLVATAIDAKPNGVGLFEAEVRSATNDIEAKWLNGGTVTRPDDEHEGQEKLIGRIVQQGASVDRLSTIARRVTPSYVGTNAVRIHVVETPQWNAMAMGNGAVWVFSGLLNDMDDDEVAIVVSHELVHYTHEHTRRELRSAVLWQLLAAGAIVATDAATDNKKTQGIVTLASLLSVMTITNNYSREGEDQADRVGLRYAYEGGFDVCKAPRLWQRFADKYGDDNKVLNFFLGDHPRASARIRNMQQQIAYNYPGCLARTVAGRASGGSADRSRQERREHEHGSRRP